MNKSEIVFKIEKILKDYSCESSPLKIADIVRKLSQENIYCNRKTVKSNIELLINAKGEIAKSKKGYYICERQFENGELIFLVDSVFSNPSIPHNYAKDLIAKLLKDRPIAEQNKFEHL